MTLSKLHLLLVAAIIGGVFLIEHGNYTRIEAQGPPAAPTVTATACPANESIPFSSECMAFIQGSTTMEAPRWLTVPANDTLSDSPELPVSGH